MAVPINPKEPYQRAFFFKKKYGFSEARLKTAAVKGLIRVAPSEFIDAPVFYNADDVAALQEIRAKRKRYLIPKRELAEAAGN